MQIETSINSSFTETRKNQRGREEGRIAAPGAPGDLAPTRSQCFANGHDIYSFRSRG